MTPAPETEILRERVRQLEDVLGAQFRAPIEWGLTPSEHIVLGVLVHRELATKDAIMCALYRVLNKDEPGENISTVYICKMRKKLRKHGVEIKTRWGFGWYLEAAVRRDLKARCVNEI